MSQEQSAEYEWIDVKELIKADYNPRDILEENFVGLRESIRRFGIVDPLVVNRRNKVVVGGHRRLDASLLEGFEKVPVRWVDLSEAEEEALNVVLNNKNIQGHFTNDLLQVIERIKLKAPDINLDALRLSAPDLKNLLPPSAFDNWATDLGKIKNVDENDRSIHPTITLVFNEEINVEETKEVIKSTLGFLNFEFR